MSIRENLNLVNENIDKQVEICKMIRIHNFIMNLEKGYDTILRENSTNISGGQKRLISLARTVLKPADILLFDEISSSLDPNTTKSIINTLKKLKKEHTIIIITHKKEIMEIADKTIIISNGQKAGENTNKDN